jgi:hypothetical protein
MDGFAQLPSHIRDLRRLLYRLHLVLTSWEEAAITEGGVEGGPETGPAAGPEGGPESGAEG